MIFFSSVEGDAGRKLFFEGSYNKRLEINIMEILQTDTNFRSLAHCIPGILATFLKQFYKQLTPAGVKKRNQIEENAALGIIIL